MDGGMHLPPRPLLASFPAILLLAAACAGVDGSGTAPSMGDDGDTTPTVDAGVKADAGAVADAAHPHPGPDASHADAADGASPPADATLDEGAPDTAPAPPGPFDVTFYVMADSHADPVPSDDLLSQARAIDAVSQGGVWPDSIDGVATGFVGGPIAPPRGVVVCGDATGWGTAPAEIPTFRTYFEMGYAAESVHHPVYVGLGNHDIDTADRDPATADAYRAQYWQYVDSRHEGPSAPVPTTSYDPASHAYSWDFDRVHLIMTHRFLGDVGYGLASAAPFVADDLKKHASDGRPVVLFHHYGMDAFGTNGQWWTPADRDAYRALLSGYGVTAIFTGHSHYAMQYSWQGLRVFQANNAKAEIDAGNNDGNGSFAIVRITDKQIDIVTCRWTDDHGGFELIGPYFSGPSDVGRAP
jgi:cytolysin (calcineurin-like family phosphatase)